MPTALCEHGLALGGINTLTGEPLDVTLFIIIGNVFDLVAAP